MSISESPTQTAMKNVPLCVDRMRKLLSPDLKRAASPMMREMASPAPPSSALAVPRLIPASALARTARTTPIENRANDTRWMNSPMPCVATMPRKIAPSRSVGSPGTVSACEWCLLNAPSRSPRSGYA